MTQTRCRGGRHRYQAIPGNGAGIERKKCVTCGSVMIDLSGSDSVEDVDAAVGLFAPRKPTLFSVKAQAEETKQEAGAGFGRPRHRR